MNIPDNLRRLGSLFIPAVTALFLIGIIPGIMKIQLNTNIAQTGITVGMILAALNALLWYMAFKHRIP